MKSYQTNSYTIQIQHKQTILTPKNVQHIYTLIWIHGMGQKNTNILNFLLSQPLMKQLKHFRIILPQAPLRYVTENKKTVFSWFDIKIRGEKSFIIPFNDSFGQSQVHESYNNILKPIILRQHQILKKSQKKIFLGGFSQGCAMSYHSLYQISNQIQLAGVFGVSGYLFSISKFNENNKTPKKLVFGTKDMRRQWKHTKITFDNKFKDSQIVLIEGMKHEMHRKQINEQAAKFFRQIKDNQQYKL